METVLESTENYLFSDRIIKKSPLIFSTEKPYYPISYIFKKLQRNVIPEVRCYRFRFGMQQEYSNLKKCLCTGGWLRELNTKSRGYIAGWLTIFEKVNRSKIDNLTPALVPVIPSHILENNPILFRSPTFSSWFNLYKKYIEVWYNKDTYRLNPYLHRWLTNNVFDLLSLEQMGLVEKSEQEFWDKAITKYTKPDFQTPSEVYDFGNNLYKEYFLEEEPEEDLSSSHLKSIINLS